MTRRVADAVADALADAGVARVWGAGSPVDGLPVVAVAEPALAALFAGADAALHGTGCSTDGSGTLRLHAAPGGAPDVHVVVDDTRLVGDAVRRAMSDVTFGVDVTIDIDVDPGAPCPRSGPAPEPSPSPSGDVEHAVDVLAAADATVVAGPGVLRARAVSALRDLAAAANVGVLNTWGAKGLFEWSDPHHLATAGLQRDDFPLAAVAEGSFVAVGLDPAETVGLPEPAVTLRAGDLTTAARAVTRRRGPIPAPALRTQLEALVAHWWSAPPSAPPSPAVLTRRYAQAVGADGLVASEAGDAGLWIARTFPTAAPGQAVVPARPVPGVAAAVAFVARLDDPSRRVVAVVDRAGPVSDAVCRTASLAGLPIVAATWDDEAAGDVDTHVDALAAACTAGYGGTFPVAVDRACRGDLEAVAGPVVAWEPELPTLRRHR